MSSWRCWGHIIPIEICDGTKWTKICTIWITNFIIEFNHICGIIFIGFSIKSQIHFLVVLFECLYSWDFLTGNIKNKHIFDYFHWIWRNLLEIRKIVLDRCRGLRRIFWIIWQNKHWMKSIGIHFSFWNQKCLPSTFVATSMRFGYCGYFKISKIFVFSVTNCCRDSLGTFKIVCLILVQTGSKPNSLHFILDIFTYKLFDNWFTIQLYSIIVMAIFIKLTSILDNTFDM